MPTLEYEQPELHFGDHSTQGSSSSSCSTSSRTSRVSFSTVSVREHDRTVSYHPEATGVGIGLDWDYRETVQHCGIDRYELRRRRRRNKLYLTPLTREMMLTNVWGCKSVELRKAQAEAKQIHDSRQQSKRQYQREIAFKWFFPSSWITTSN